MFRDFGREIDELNVQLGEIKGLLMNLTEQPQKKESVIPPEYTAPLRSMNSDQRLTEIMEELCEKAAEEKTTGFVTYLGVHSSGGQGATWISNQVNVDSLLDLIKSNTAAKVLACIGNNDRLNMLLALLHAPKTVAQLIEECGYNTTGQVYHHLKPLIAVDLIKEDENCRGSYVVQPHRVQGVIMLLAGISDIVDTKYTKSDLL